MCDPVKAIKRALTPAGTGGQDAARAASESATLDLLQKQDQRAALAAAAQQQATDQAKAASDTASESVVQRRESRLRKIGAFSAFGANRPSPGGAASIAYRQLFGN